MENTNYLSIVQVQVEPYNIKISDQRLALNGALETESPGMGFGAKTLPSAPAGVSAFTFTYIQIGRHTDRRQFIPAS